VAGEAEAVVERRKDATTQGGRRLTVRHFASLRPCVFASLFAFVPQPGTRPPPNPPAPLAPLIGEYGADTVSGAMILESGGTLYLRRPGAGQQALRPAGRDRFRFGDSTLRFVRSRTGKPEALLVGAASLPRQKLGPAEGSVFRITPVRPVAELIREALAATPPVESGVFRTSELTELVALDSTIKLDIRYAGPNNFLGTKVYSSARAFLQRPAAEALVRAHRRLRALGYGLLIHDGYRPWYVSKVFWEATPPSQHEFVADPAQGSRHNRGAAVDLTLYERSTGRPVEMPGTYDEFSRRSYPDYPGGTSRQRWLRELLRNAMEGEGFKVFQSEWWHFDYQDWRLYPLGNERFEELTPRR
jgi:D-alanyl-D-alanine dipeptidase